MDKNELEAEIIKYYKKNKSRGKAYTARHFAKFERNPPTKASASKKVLTDATNSSETNLPQTSTGRVHKKTTAKTSAAIAPAAISFINENYSNKGEILLANCQTRCETLLQNFKGHDWILIHRAGFSFRNNQGSHANPGYWSFPGMPPPKMPPRSDYIAKLNVCVAFSSKGVSEPFIQRVGEKFDHKTYLSEFVEKKLVPFIQTKHKDLKHSVIWADAQPTFFNKNVLAYLDEKHIKHVDKEDNPGNRVKCFSYFLNFLRNKIYNNWHAQNEADLERRIKDCLKNIDMNVVKRLANDTENRIQEMAEIGELNVWSDKNQKYTGSY